MKRLNQKYVKWHHDPLEYENFLDKIAPVVLFVYKRIDHVTCVIDALKQNPLSKYTTIYIYSDAAKDKQDYENVSVVRRYLKGISGFKKIFIIEREKNWGLLANITSGVTEVVEQHGKVIVLEDDIVVSKYFLTYMNDALNLYENDEKVMAVSGFWWSTDKDTLPDTFFSPWFTVWGWGTWRRSWRCFDRNPSKVLREFPRDEIPFFNIYGEFDLWSQVEGNACGRLESWAVFFMINIWQKGGLVLHSKHDLCKNIGFDGTGEHCKSSFNDKFQRNDLWDGEVSSFTDCLEVNNEAVKSLVAWFDRQNKIAVKRTYEFIKFCREGKKIYCYGAGTYGIWVAGMLARIGCDIDAFLETEKTDRVDCYGRPVYSFSKKIRLDNVNIIVAANLNNRMEMVRELERQSIEDYFVLDDEIKICLPQVVNEIVKKYRIGFDYTH